MTDQADTTARPREIAPAEWGRAVLEDILFRAARDISERGPGDAPIPVVLKLQVVADPDSRGLIISMAGAVEPVLLTRLPLQE